MYKYRHIATNEVLSVLALGNKYKEDNWILTGQQLNDAMTQAVAEVWEKEVIKNIVWVIKMADINNATDLDSVVDTEWLITSMKKNPFLLYMVQELKVWMLILLTI